VRVDFEPPVALAWLELAAGVTLALACLVVDAGGRILVLPGAALLLALGLRDALARPTLSLQSGGLVVVIGLHRRAVPWSTLERARVVTDRRAPLLELDLGDTVVVLSRRRLGVPPHQALEALEEIRATR
jgi:hypothetical protein